MPRFTVTQVAVRREGSVLLADALVTLAFPSPSGDLIARAHDLNALVRVNSRWRFAHHSETPVATLDGQPVVAAPDSGALGQFVGDYEVYPGAVDRIIQRGARLIMQDADHPGLHDKNLVAAGAESFYPENESQGLMVFVRDTTGRVTHYIMRIAGGPVIISRRVR
jgi:hypothetical protein